MLILYGTQTGNSKYVAEEIGRECTRRYIKARVMAMDDYNIIDLPTERMVCFVISTTGQGECTASMKNSWRFLTRKDLPKNSLEKVNFTVFGLGDSSYEIFNAMARKVYQRMLQLGANCFHERALGDEQHDFGYEAEFDPWLESLWDKIYELEPSLRPESVKPEDSIEESVYLVDLITQPDRETMLSEEEKQFLVDNSDSSGCLDTLKFYNDAIDAKSSKLFGTVEANKLITSQQMKDTEDKETRHIEINFGDQEFTYNPGDVCCVYPRNNKEQILEFLKSQDLNADDLLRIRPNKEADSSSVPLKFPLLISTKELFQYWLNTFGVPNRYFFKIMTHYTDDEIRREKLHILCSKTTEGKSEYYRYCHREKRTHAEILYDFPT